MEEKKKSRLPVFLAIIFVLILAALYVYLYILPQISGSRTETVVVSYASIQASAKLKCILARDETVFTSGNAGTVSYYAEEGAKIRRGELIADVYSGKKESFYAPKTGFVTYFLDGCEDQFLPDGFAGLDPDALAELEDIKPASGKPTQVEGDVPIFKVVTSNTWYVLMIVPEEMKGQYRIAQNLTVEFGDGAQLPARVSYIGEGEHHQLVAAEISRWYEKFLQLRTVEADIISANTEGLLVPTSGITTNGETYGVLVKDLDGDYSFRAIEVLIEGPENTLIADGGQVRLYDEVLKDARDHSD